MIKTIQKFGATWCGPCKALDKTLSQVTGVDIVKFDADDDEDLFTKNNIRNVPTMLFLDESGSVVQRTTGAIPLGQINQIIQDNA